MKIVVAGGTGFLGRHISRELLDAGHAVVVLTRDPEKLSAIPQLVGANAIRADVTRPSSLVGTLEGVDAVVGAVQFPNYPMEKPNKGLTFDRFDRQGTEHLLAEAKSANVAHFLYMSGAGVDPNSDKSWYRAKGRAEESIRASGLRYALLRPSWAYGPEDKALNKFVKIARFSPFVPKPGVAPQRIQPVYVGDVAVAVRKVFERDAWDETLELGTREVMTMDEVVRTMCDVLGKRRVVVSIPVGLMKLATAPLDLLPKPALNPIGVEFAVQDGLVDPSRAETLLDWSPLTLREGLSRYLS